MQFHLFHLQIDHDLRLWRHADALQHLLDIFSGEFLGHGDTTEARVDKQSS